MAWSKPEQLFSSSDLLSRLEVRTEQAKEMVRKIPRDQFMVSTDEQILDHIMSVMHVAPLVLHSDRQVASHEEIHIGASAMINRQLMMPGLRVTVSIPYSGTSELWQLTPSRYSLTFPSGRTKGSGSSENGFIDIILEEDINAPPDRLKSRLDRSLELIAEYLAYQKHDIDVANARMDSILRQAILERRANLEKQEGMVRMLGIPLQTRAGVPDARPVHLEPRILRPLPQFPKGGYKAEYGLTDEQYEFILSIIRHEGRTQETTPATYQGLDEPALRNILLAHLNGHFKGGATGETFRGNGKTDIRIELESRAAFVAECKL